MKRYLLTISIILSLLIANTSPCSATPASLGNGVTWELDGTTLTIGYIGSGSGVMPTYTSGSDANRPWNSNKASITNIIVEEGITIIGAYAFHGCNAAATVSLPSTLDSIGYNVFQSLTTSCATTFHGTIEKWCSVGMVDYDSNPFYKGDGKFRTEAGIITTLTIPDGVTRIKPLVFRGTTITKLTIPTSVTVIGAHAFRECSSLSSVTFTATSKVDSIATYAFANCTALTSLAIPSSVRTIGTYAFNGCSALTTIDFNNATKLKTIGNYAFQGTTKLSTLSLRGATSLVTIGQNAFNLTSGNSTAIGYLYIPSSVRTIGANAFTNRTGLNGIVIMNTNTSDASLTKCAASTSFTSVPTSIPVYVNSSTLATTYGSLTGWSSFTNITSTNEVTFNCGTPTASALVAHLNMRTGALTFTGSGDMKDYSSAKADWKLDKYAMVLKSVTISNMSRIGAYAFYQCSGLTGSVSIPSIVVSIGGRAFRECSGLTGLSLSNATSLTTIDTYAFYGCTKIASDIVFPATLTTLGTYAFYNCSSVTSLDMQNVTSLTTIGQSTFQGMSNVGGYIYIPSSVTTLGSSALSGMTSITGIIAAKATAPTATATYTFNYIDKTIPIIVQNSTAAEDYISKSGWNEFSNYQYAVEGQCGDYLYWSLNPFTGALSITGSGEMWNYNGTDNKAPWYFLKSKIITVSISKDVESIGEYAFKDCSNVTSFTFNYDAGTNHNSLVSIGQYAFQNCSSASFTNLWGSWSANLTSVGTGAFNTCTQLTSVTIPENITFMDDMVFTGCSGLATVVWNATNYTGTNISNLYNPFYSNRSTITSFTFGTNVETIPAYLCYNMSHLTGTLTIANNIQSIGDHAFYGCSGYTALAFEAGCQLTSIPNYAFYQCTNLTLSSSYFPSTITSIGNYAFQDCTHITSVNFGTSSYVTSIGEYAFKGCTGITSITLGTYSRLTSIGSYAFNGCTNIAETNITLPPNLTTLGTYAFDGCAKLKGTLTIKCPNLTAIGNYAFRDCGFTKLDLTGASSLTTIGNSAFSGCSSITGEIYIPATVTSIGTKAFYNCSAVTSMYVEPTSIPTATSGTTTGTFQGMTNTIPVRVPGSMVSDYRSAAGWEYFTTHIQAYAAGQCGDNLYWRINYDKSRLEITGSGAMYDYNDDSNRAPWRSYTSYWTTISFPETMTTFGKYAFYNCTNLRSSLSFLAGLKEIRAYAFSGCTGIYGLTFSSATSLTTIGQQAFYGCNHSSFTTLTLPNSLTTIQGSAFGLCSSLTTVTIPKNVTTMVCSTSANTFWACSNITTVNWNAVACNDFTSTEDSYGVVSYHTPWGTSKSNITQFKIASDVRIIPKFLCQALTSITSISLGDSIREIHEGAFMGCTSLADVTLPANITTLGNSAFNGCSAMTKLDMSLANKLTSIGTNAFEGCSNVDGLIYVPASVTSIGNGSFKDFSKVDTIIASRNLPPTAVSGTFTNMVKSIPLIVPDADAITAYGGATGWEEFTNIKTHTFSGKCGENLYWSLNPASGELDITGSGPMYDFTMEGSPWYAHRTYIKRVNVEDGATYIGHYAFRNCKSLQYISLPTSITSMGSGIFGTGTGQLKDYSYAGTLEQWLAIDFNGHTGNPTYATRGRPNIEGSYITDVVIPDGYTTVKPYVFTYCQGLKTLSLPGTLTSLQSGCFYYCDSLTDIYCYAETPPTLPATNAGVFSTNLIKTATLHVLCDDAVDAYRAYSSYSDHWGRFTTIVPIREWCDELVVEDDATLSEEISNGFEGNIIVQSGATLEMDDLGAISVTIHNLTLEPRARIELASGASYEVDNLIMQRSGDSSDDDVATAEIKGSLTADNLILDFTLDDSRWFTISLPQTIAANAVTVDGVAQTPFEDYYALYFDGASRAASGFSASGDNWQWVVNGDELTAGQGYLIGLPEGPKTLRFTMPGYTFNETANKNVAVHEYASWDATNAGWNLIGNPYLQNYHNTTSSMTVGESTLTSMITMSIDGEVISYSTPAVEDAILPPFSAMFVQSPADGNLVFTAASARKTLRARQMEEKPFHTLCLSLSGNGGQDNTRFLVGDYYDTYIIGADLVKWFNDAYTKQVAPTLYSFKADERQAVNARSAEALHDIPVGFHATAAGTYTFSLGKEAAAFDHVWLYDSEKQITTDLKMNSYEFISQAGSIDHRFTLSASLMPEHNEVATGVEDVRSETTDVVRSEKFLRDGSLFIIRDGKTYNAQGALVQ